MTGVSGRLLDHHLLRYLDATAGPEPRAVLDIGPGRGKFAEYIRPRWPAAHLTAYEVDGEYVERFGLRALYHTVHVAPAADLLAHHDQTWDLVTIGDVLEHMPKHVGLDLLHFLVYRARVIWFQWPERYIQGPLEGHVSEVHVSVWGEADVQGLNADYRLWREAPIAAALIEGYLDHAPALALVGD